MTIEPTEIAGWVVHFDEEGFSVAPRFPRHAYDFGDPRTYPIALALPVVFASRGEAGRCVEWLERLVGRLVLSGKVRPAPAPNSVESIVGQMRRETQELMNRRGPTAEDERLNRRPLTAEARAAVGGAIPEEQGKGWTV